MFKMDSIEFMIDEKRKKDFKNNDEYNKEITKEKKEEPYGIEFILDDKSKELERETKRDTIEIQGGNELSSDEFPIGNGKTKKIEKKIFTDLYLDLDK